MNPYVKSVKAQADHVLLLTFENGEKRAFDLKPYLEKGVFMRLKNPASFRTARVVAGSVEWQGEIDLSYDTLYIESRPVQKGSARRSTSSKRKKSPAALTKRNRAN